MLLNPSTKEEVGMHPKLSLSHIVGAGKFPCFPTPRKMIQLGIFGIVAGRHFELKLTRAFGTVEEGREA